VPPSPRNESSGGAGGVLPLLQLLPSPSVKRLPCRPANGPTASRARRARDRAPERRCQGGQRAPNGRVPKGEDYLYTESRGGPAPVCSENSLAPLPQQHDLLAIHVRPEHAARSRRQPRPAALAKGRCMQSCVALRLHRRCEVMNRRRIHDRGSRGVQALEAAWTELQAVIKGLPTVVFVSLSATTRGRLGHFARSSWHYLKTRNAHELAINPRLFEFPEELLETMLHEAAHALLNERDGNPGAGHSRYYHTKEFRDCCLGLGLQCTFRNTRYGFSDTDWQANGIPDRYLPVLAILRRDLPWGTARRVDAHPVRARPLPDPGRCRLVCPCDRVIYLGKKSAAAGPILCGLCGQPFSPREK
jgi:hypothetical protein